MFFSPLSAIDRLTFVHRNACHRCGSIFLIFAITIRRMLSARDVRHVMMSRDDNLGMEMRTFASQYEGSDEEFDDPGSLRVRAN